MTAIDVTPAGNQLFQVDIHDRDGSSRHQVAVPDDLVERMDTDGVSMQSLVHAAVEYLTSHAAREDLDPRVDLGEVAARFDDFTSRVPAMARERATTDEPPTGTRAAAEQGEDEAPLTGSDRLVAETKQAQADGQASSQTTRY